MIGNLTQHISRTAPSKQIQKKQEMKRMNRLQQRMRAAMKIQKDAFNGFSLRLLEQLFRLPPPPPPQKKNGTENPLNTAAPDY